MTEDLKYFHIDYILISIWYEVTCKYDWTKVEAIPILVKKIHLLIMETDFPVLEDTINFDFDQLCLWNSVLIVVSIEQEFPYTSLTN